MESKLMESLQGMRDLIMFRNIKLLLHLLVPLFVHGIAHEMSSPFLMEVISHVLCPGESICSYALYLNSLQKTLAGLLMIPVLPILCELSDEYGRKPLLLLTMSTSIFPIVLLAINKSRAFIYAYFALRCLSYILSLRSVFCIAIAYAADVVEDDKKVAAFSWITGVMSASYVLGSLLAKFIPGKYIFELSIPLLIMSPLFIQLFVAETARRAPMTKQSLWSIFFKSIRERYSSIKCAAAVIFTKPNLRGIYLVSFFYEFGMSGISSVLLFYMKDALKLNGSKVSETLMIVQVGSVCSQMLIVPVINTLTGEKAILSMGLLASVTYAFFYSMAWATWLPYISVSLGLAYGFVKPSICAIISRASSSNDQGRAQGFLAAVDSIAGFVSPLIMTPLTQWFLSNKAPFDCKGFSLICAAFVMMVALFVAMPLKPETTWNHDLKVVLLT
ncbi:hippocampus abundant transcript-like protein 1 isoform X1 [Chenopodium quinoa]|uniref:hippocampus abundant transcript-like protein 1 isoform X1 n=2 Tax=Chenopodium quinoa TaxID=63459 RepID=UPI000B794348|nr:hippocampus abundant transcript-like protein 1 isoform X1 [Chenopodium quinoa]